MIKCVYCNRPAVSEKVEVYRSNEQEFRHSFSHCESCKEDFVTPHQMKINEERRGKP